MADPRFRTDHGRIPAISWGRKRRKEIITAGSIPDDGEGFVYVGVSEGGRVKIGMSSNPSRRGRALGVDIHFVMPIRPQAAKELETLALQCLGHKQGDGEWLLKPDRDEAVKAVRIAMDLLRRRLWVDPHLTEDEARQLRIRLAVNDEAEAGILAAPDRRFRSSLITSHRTVAGMKTAYGNKWA